MSDGRTWGTVIGGVVGFFTGGIGWAAGAAIGGVVGGLLEPKKHTETNRIDDIKVSMSKYGDGIPETRGNNIPSATCVWSTYIIQLPENQSSGKGGGVENTNYRQFIQSMWCLGRTPDDQDTPIAIRKVWIDGKLNYDASSGLSVGQALATEENPFASIALLPGYDDQLPVAMIETFEGVGNVPAFRGRICLFIFGLECPGGRIPQLQFELCIGATVDEVKQTYVDFDRGVTGLVYKDEIWHLNQVENGAGNPKALEVFHGAPGESSLIRSIEMQVDTIEGTVCPVIGSPTPKAVRGILRFLSGSNTLNQIQLFDLVDGTTVAVLDRLGVLNDSALGISSPMCSAFDPVSERFAFIGGAGPGGGITAPNFQLSVLIMNGALQVVSDPLPVALAKIAFYDSFVYAIYYDGLYKLAVIDEAGTIVRTIVGPGPASVANSVAAMVQADSNGVYVWVRWGVSDARIYKVDATSLPGSWELVTDSAQPADSIKWETESTSFYTDGRIAIVGPSSVDIKYDLIRLNVIEPVEADVAEIIASQSERAGLTPAQFDVSTIDASVWGLTFKTPASARSNIAPLMTYAAIGVVEEDGLLRYFHRAEKISIDTVPYEDLGFAEDGSEPGDPFPLVHSNAQEFPRSIALTYNDQNFDYQQVTVKAMRYAVDTVLDETQVLDIASDGSTMQSLVNRLLYERWLSQNTRTFAVSRKYSYWSAGDVVTFLRKDGTGYGAFMIGKLADTGARIEGECFPADGDLIIQTVPGPSGFHAQQIEPLAPATRVLPVDTSILRDVDNNAGLYVAMSSYSQTYPGGELFVDDEDPPQESAGTVSMQAAAGSAETLLGDFALGIVDESHLVTVAMGPFTLNGITRAVLLSTSSDNLAAIGAAGRWEIIKFQRADSLGEGRYILSGLLRGQRGTEWARGLHQSGDAFVLLGAGGILRPNLDTASIGQTMFYRGVTVGRSFNSASSRTYVNTAEGLKPFAPSTLRKDDSTGDIVLTWSRRTRLSENFLLGVVPLGENRERFEIDIFSDGTFTALKRTLSATTTAATYTSAQQVIDFGSAQATVHLRIYQLSEIGRGHELQVSL